MEADYSAYAARPADVAAWEELLLRLELGPRALRVQLERAAPACAEPLLRERLLGERRTLELLEALAQARAAAPAAAATAEPDGPAAALLAEFERLRRRGFAAVQRRGIEVWDWAIDSAGGAPLTAYRLLAAAVDADGRTLAALRAC